MREEVGFGSFLFWLFIFKFVEGFRIELGKLTVGRGVGRRGCGNSRVE